MPSEALYHATVSCHPKALLFSYTAYRRKGSIVKQVLKYEWEITRAEDEQLASAYTLNNLVKNCTSYKRR